MRPTFVRLWFFLLTGLIVSLFLAPRATAGDGQTYDLRYRFEPNQVVRYSVEHSFQQEVRKGEFVESASSETHSEKHFRVLSVDARGNATLELVVDRARLTAKFDSGDPVTYDSTRDETAPRQFRNVQSSIGKANARITVSPKGELVSSRIIRTAPGESGDDPDSRDANRNFVILLPNEPVKVGDSWKDTSLKVSVDVTRTLKRDITMLRKYTLLSVDDSIATIQLETQELEPIQDGQILGQLILRRPEGIIRFDIRHGVIVDRHLKTDRREFNATGDGSSMHARDKRVEKLIANSVESTGTARQ